MNLMSRKIISFLLITLEGKTVSMWSLPPATHADMLAACLVFGVPLNNQLVVPSLFSLFYWVFYGIYRTVDSCTVCMGERAGCEGLLL